MGDSETYADGNERWRTDKENDRILCGDTAIVILDEDGERMSIDHASGMDGYVAFREKGDHDGHVKADGDGATLHFMDAPTVECVYCEEPIPQGEIENHHIDEHPMKRWNPAYYPEVFDSDEEGRNNRSLDAGNDD